MSRGVISRGVISAAFLTVYCVSGIARELPLKSALF
jgi:hypothetical protein